MAIHHECAIRTALMVLRTIWARDRSQVIAAAIKILADSVEDEKDEEEEE